jgi:protein-S-isoprenylcysteine O-methyltransferase Ste14
MPGFIIAFWSAPLLTWGHLVFSVMTTPYIVVGMNVEERDLRNGFGARYDEYRQQVSMRIPWIGKKAKT